MRLGTDPSGKSVRIEWVGLEVDILLGRVGYAVRIVAGNDLACARNPEISFRRVPFAFPKSSIPRFAPRQSAMTISQPMSGG